MNDCKVEKDSRYSVSSIIGLILCIVFGFLLICNLTIIIKGTLHPETPPSVLGTTPMVVLSGSMSGDAEDHIEAGDLVFIGKTNPETLEVGDIIAFMEGSTVVTHRIIEIQVGADGQPQFVTKGDANNTQDEKPVTAENLVGIYKGRLPKVGDFALFLRTPIGMLIFVGVPLLGFILYDLLRRQRYVKQENKKTAELEAELERLRAIAAEQGDAARKADGQTEE